MTKAMRVSEGRLLAEQALDAAAAPTASMKGRKGNRNEERAARSRTVNLAESPLGWLLARGHVTQRQFDAGERLRLDWERAQLEPSVTMRWDAGPIGRGGARGAGTSLTAGEAQVAAKQRFLAAVDSVGPGLGDIAWRIVCAGEGMRQAESALGWPARAGKLVLGLALDRIAAYYRMP